MTDEQPRFVLAAGLSVNQFHDALNDVPGDYSLIKAIATETNDLDELLVAIFEREDVVLARKVREQLRLADAFTIDDEGATA